MPTPAWTVASAVAALAWLACDAGTPSGGAPPPDSSGARLEQVATGLDFPVYLTAPAGDARLFVVEKTGRIRIVRNGAVVAAPFLDLSARVSDGSEQGLLGLAFDPHYAQNGRFFVDYTDKDGNTRISRFSVSSSSADVADAASESAVIEIDQPYANHNGGQVVFGPDGYLYIGMGDGGSGGDPQGHGQNAGDLLASILRVDVSAASGYAIPADNPFVHQAGARGELWDIGLRNPWRFSFDRSGGDLYIADVGQNAWEEVDVSPASNGAGRGLNYGWNRMEGTHCYEGSTCDRQGLTLPVLEYDHADGCSITGGYVYRGSAVPALRGMYFYADYCSGWVRSFTFAGGRATDPRSWPSLRPGGQITSFGEDANGELYILQSDGKVFRVVAQ
jgi:glucose/arabinose dehydrogenase